MRVSLPKVLVCAVVIVLGVSGVSSAAIHIVRPGDTLWVLASRYGVAVEDIAEANDLRDVDRLRLGLRLTIPDGGSAAVRPARASRASTGQRVSVTAKRVPTLAKRGPTVRHEVTAGETLWGLARRHDMRVSELAALNGIDAEGTLRIGQVLRVPTSPKAMPPARLAPSGRSTLRGPTLPYRGTQWAHSLLGLARRFRGTRYRWGGTTPAGFDCSGFLYYVFGRMGVGLPRTSYNMFYAGRPVPAGQIQPGDLVFFTTYRRGPSHAGIYVGNGHFIHASSGYGSVTVTPLSHDYYRKRYLGARRF